jgi:hypothetical protein
MIKVASRFTTAVEGHYLSTNEALELTWIARRITALVLMRPLLDENYWGCVAHGA